MVSISMLTRVTRVTLAWLKYGKEEAGVGRVAASRSNPSTVSRQGTLQCMAHCIMPSGNYTLHTAVTAVHCILHAEYETLNTAKCTMSQQGKLHAARCTPGNYTVHTAVQCTTHRPLHIRTTEDTGLQQDH